MLAALVSLALSSHTLQAAEFSSPDTVVKALYDVISGPAGGKRDWDRMRSLFAPQASMVAIYRTKASGMKRQVLTVEDYIRISGPYLEKNGFFEKEVAKRVEEFGSLRHVWSTYESRSKAEDAKPFERGINSIQLWNDGQRWWITSIAWQGEDSKTLLPKKYLGPG